MRIKHKLILLTVIPLLALIFMGAQGFARSTRTVQEMRDLRSLTDLATKISAAIHETQKERGRTAGFLGGKGEVFGKELADQQALTDEKVAQLRAFLDGFDAGRFGGAFEKDLGAALDDLSRIDQTRRSVGELSIDTPRAIGYYTSMNAKFLDLIGSITHHSSNAELSVALMGYANFLKNKERAGIERAVLSNTFAADRFGPGMYRKFISLVTEQQSYTHEFLICASDEAAQAYESAKAHPSFGRVEDYRAIAFNRYEEGGFGVDAGEWFDTISEKINQLKAVDDSLARELTDKAGAVLSASAEARIWLGGTILGVVAVILLIAYLTTRSITLPIRLIVDSLKDIAEGEGDLTRRVDAERRDELGELGRWFNTFIENVQSIVIEVTETTREVATASTQIASQSEELSSGMDEQRHQISQISAAIEQMSCSVVEVARKSGEAANNAREAGQVAREGGTVVNETVNGMESISEAVTASAASVSDLGKRGEQIGQIIEVINDIADQTNLLALNAAIEAARAGEHGRGFAVVADEVRKLADRTTSATEEIGQSIQAIQTETEQAVQRMSAGTEHVSEGVRKATEAGQSLQRIVTSTEAVAGMIQTIAAAADEQSLASQQVSENISQMSAVTDQSREATTETASAVAQLSQKAESLQTLIGRFKVA